VLKVGIDGPGSVRRAQNVHNVERNGAAADVKGAIYAVNVGRSVGFGPVSDVVGTEIGGQRQDSP
jgi:hypothetical protein